MNDRKQLTMGSPIPLVQVHDFTRCNCLQQRGRRENDDGPVLTMMTCRRQCNQAVLGKPVVHQLTKTVYVLFPHRTCVRGGSRYPNRPKSRDSVVVGCGSGWPNNLGHVVRGGRGGASQVSTRCVDSTELAEGRIEAAKRAAPKTTHA